MMKSKKEGKAVDEAAHQEKANYEATVALEKVEAEKSLAKKALVNKATIEVKRKACAQRRATKGKTPKKAK